MQRGSFGKGTTRTDTLSDFHGFAKKEEAFQMFLEHCFSVAISITRA